MKNLLQKSKCVLACVSFAFLAGQSAFAGNASVVLDYKNNRTDNEKYADMIMNTISVKKSADSTYFGIMDWYLVKLDGEKATSLDGGFCGFQQAKGYINRTGSITMWENDGIDMTFEQACDSFRYTYNPSADKNGLSTSFHCDYAENYVYSVVSRVWNDGGNSKFGFWYLDHTNSFWLHVVTMVYSSENLKFANHIRSYIEDFSEAGKMNVNRSMILAPAAVRTLDGAWHEKNEASIYGMDKNENYSGSLLKNAFHMQLGGVSSSDPAALMTTTESFVASNRINTDYFEMMDVENASLSGDGKLTWSISISKLPQFAYNCVVTDEKGEEVYSVGAIDSDAREASVKVGKNGSYVVTLTLTDIFDNEVVKIFRYDVTNMEEPVVPTEPEKKTNSCLDIVTDFTVQPTGVNVVIPVEVNNSMVEAKIVDKNGNLALAGGSFGPQMMHGPYDHSLYLNTYGLPLNGEYYFVATVNGEQCMSRFSAARGLYDEDEPVADNVEGIKYVYSTFYSTVLGFESNVEVNAVVTISSIWGWTAMTKQITLQKGLNSYLFDVNGLSVGQTFTINVSVNGQVYSEKFMVK